MDLQTLSSDRFGDMNALLTDAGRMRLTKKEGCCHIEINPALLEGDTGGTA
jgi:hypothetical protein